MSIELHWRHNRLPLPARCIPTVDLNPLGMISKMELRRHRYTTNRRRALHFKDHPIERLRIVANRFPTIHDLSLPPKERWIKRWQVRRQQIRRARKSLI